MLCHLMQNKFFIIGDELEKDRCKDVELRELNDTEGFTSDVLFHEICCSKSMVYTTLSKVP